MATVSRLPIYLRVLVDLVEQRRTTISSEALAELSGVNASKVRKDLSFLGTYGTRGVGYDVALLLREISRELGLTQDWPVAIVGFGNLGHALVNYKGFEERGFHVVAVFDAAKAKVGQKFGRLKVQDIADIPRAARDHHIAIAIIATPATVAQEVADKVVAAGIKSILNFAPAIINVPAEVSVRKVDLSMELQILSFYQQRTRN